VIKTVVNEQAQEDWLHADGNDLKLKKGSALCQLKKKKPWSEHRLGTEEREDTTP